MGGNTGGVSVEVLGGKKKKFICYLKQKKGTYSKDICFPRISQRLEGINIIREAEIRGAPDGLENLQHKQPGQDITAAATGHSPPPLLDTITNMAQMIHLLFLDLIYPRFVG